jgi:hypothetical protein
VDYEVFVSPDWHYLCPNTGNVGDIFVKTTHGEEVVNALNLGSNLKINRPANYEQHHIYYKTENGWMPADARRRDDNGKPYTKHPSLKSSVLLDDFVFRWRSVRSYHGTNREIPNQPRDGKSVELSRGMWNGNFC